MIFAATFFANSKRDSPTSVTDMLLDPSMMMEMVPSGGTYRYPKAQIPRLTTPIARKMRFPHRSGVIVT